MCSDNSGHSLVGFITELPSDPNYIAESCPDCGVIRSYNINSGEGKIVYDKGRPFAMCKGPDKTLLVMDSKQNMSQLKWDKEKKELQLISSITTAVKPDVIFHRMC